MMIISESWKGNNDVQTWGHSVVHVEITFQYWVFLMSRRTQVGPSQQTFTIPLQNELMCIARKADDVLSVCCCVGIISYLSLVWCILMLWANPFILPHSWCNLVRTNMFVVWGTHFCTPINIYDNRRREVANMPSISFEDGTSLPRHSYPPRQPLLLDHSNMPDFYIRIWPVR